MSTTPESKRDRRLAARAERQRLAEEGKKRAKQRRALTLGGLVVLVVAVLALGGYFAFQSLTQPMPGRVIADEGRGHVSAGAPLSFNENPPASGTHYPTWTRPGVYTEPQNPGNWVHSLEHGYIVILYTCPDGCPDLVSELRTFYESAPRSAKYGYQKLVITPYADMENRITAIAWNRKLELDSFDADQLMTFYRTYLDKGPEDAS